MKNAFLTTTLLTTSLLMAVTALAQGGGGTDDPKTHVTTIKKPHATKTTASKKHTNVKAMSPTVPK